MILTKINQFTNTVEQRRILVVDDDELVVESFTRTLSEFKNFCIDSTTNSTKALSLVTENDYDIVISDLVMPDLDGIQLLRKIKKIRPNTEVILITAFSSYSSALDAMHFGAFDYIPKPFNPEEFKLRINRALNKRNAVLEKLTKVEEMERLIYTIAHDFKSFCISINGFSRILLDEYSDKLKEEGSFLITRINANVGEMEKMIEGLLQYTRIGRFEETWDVIDTYHLLRELADNFSPILREKEIDLIIENSIPKVYFYREGIRTIFTNLIDNAIKYSRDDVQSFIKIGTTSLPQKDEKDFVKFFIEDNGIGIVDKNLTRIFEIFQRENSQAEKEGYGIGLAIVKRILETSHGEIYAQSEKGKNTFFYFTLPRIPKE